MTAARYVSVLERLYAMLDERESDFVRLETTGATRGRYLSAIARTQQRKREVRSMLDIGRRLLAPLGGDVPAAVCTDDGEPDECDDDGSGGSGGSGESTPSNSTRHVVVNPMGSTAGMSLTTSVALLQVTGVFHDHHLQVSQNGTVVYSDSLQTNADYVGTDQNNSVKNFTTMINYSVCGYAVG